MAPTTLEALSRDVLLARTRLVGPVPVALFDRHLPQLTALLRAHGVAAFAKFQYAAATVLLPGGGFVDRRSE